MSLSTSLPWSEGEHRIHEWLKVPEHDNPTATYLTSQAAYAVANYPLIVVGVADDKGVPWTTIWGGALGHARPIGQDLIGVSTAVAQTDPVRQALNSGGFEQRMISGLAIDLVKRKRVKLFGKVVAGAVKDDHVQMIIGIKQSLGNCPKYLNQWDVQHVLPEPSIVSEGSLLSTTAIHLIENADLFFMTTINAGVDMDTNHRGGAQGFVRVESSDRIVYPEYSGNRLYQSLGNIVSNPLVGLCFPNFLTGDVLYIAGEARILVGNDASDKIPHTTLAVTVTIRTARLVEKGLPVRGRLGQFSPYNPRLRNSRATADLTKPDIRARMIWKEDITPTISRYRFSTEHSLQHKPGQWVVFDLADELDIGYSHMRDDDPLSLNDDYVRTFTISSHPDDVPHNEFEVTLRTNGPVTTYLRRQRVQHVPELKVVAVGGDFVIQQDDGLTAFVAGGVGVTPLLGQLSALDQARLRLIWIVKAEDIEFVLDVMNQHPALASHATIFLTASDLIPSKLEEIGLVSGVTLLQRRPTAEDFEDLTYSKWYICASQPLRRLLLEWLRGRAVFYENFDY